MVLDQLTFDSSDGCIHVRSPYLQRNFMKQLSQELHKTLEKTFQRSPALFRVSALHLPVCYRSLDVSKYPMDEAECQNFNIFFI